MTDQKRKTDCGAADLKNQSNCTIIRPGSKGTFSAVYNGKNLGKFDSIKDAETAHYKAKLEAIKQVAEEYKEIIPQKVYDALINWS